MTTKTCPGCEGEKIRYQLESDDHLTRREWEEMGKPWSAMKVKCPTCNGTGKVAA